MKGLPIPTGAVAVVTGAALGIGLALSERLASAGFNVVMADLPGADLDEAVMQVSRAANSACRVLAVPSDVSSAGQIGNLHEQALNLQYGEVCA